jgi:inorganic pyrophosphatase
MMEEKFWQRLEELVAQSEIVIDRPKGTAHPRFPAFIYPLDYGFLKGVKGSDHEDLDIWLGSLSKEVTGVIVTVDILKKDVEAKILIGCTPDELQTILKAMNSHYMSAQLLLRHI